MLVSLRRILILSAVLASSGSAAAPVPRPGVAKDAEIVTVTGEGWVRLLAAGDWLDAAREQELTAGDALRTGDFGRMGVLFVDGVQIRISRKTTLTVKEVAGRGAAAATTLSLERGEIWSRAKAAPDRVRVQTPSATAAIRGTDWDLVVDEQGTSHLTVLRGSVEFFNDFGRLLLETGQQATAEVGRAPVRTFLVQPRERVQWVFAYPIDVARLVPLRTHVRREALDALAAARAQVARAPADTAAVLDLASLHADLREDEEARRLTARVLAAEPANSRAHMLRGLLALREGDNDLADISFDRAMAAEVAGAAGPSFFGARLGKAGAHLQNGRIAPAVQIISELLAREDAPAAVGVAAASLHAFLGEFTLAREIATDFAAREPGDSRFPTLLAGFHLILDDASAAEAAARRAIALEPEFSGGHTVLGQIHHLEGRGPEAEQSFRAALELDPGNTLALNGLALVRAERGHFREALAMLTEAVALAPESSILWANRGYVSTLLERLEDARGDFRRALEVDPGQHVAVAGEALVAIKKGRPAEAIDRANRASLLEPRLARPHGTGAIALYQEGRIDQALRELDLAAQLDPNDPFPHLVAYLIYQDTYRPWLALREARKVLDRLPYLKSVDALENTRQGVANLGSALLGFGLPEWSESYAQESFSPHNASSHFQASRRYATNRSATVSELVQGLLLDPLANSQATRFQDLIRRPRMNLSAGGSWGGSEDSFSQGYDVVWQGYTRLPWEVAWSVAANHNDSDGDVPNSQSRGNAVAIGIGVKPDFDNGFNLGVSLSDAENGQPGSVIAPDPDDSLGTKDGSVDLGYRRRFGPKNNLLARVAVSRYTTDFTNPAPFGTGMTDEQAAFLFAGYTVDETRGFFQQGVYDLSGPLGGPTTSLATDATGTVAGIAGVVALPTTFPDFVDFDLRSQDRRRELSRLFQARHLLAIGDTHEFTYGADFITQRAETLLRYADYQPSGTIDFYEEPILDPDGFAWTFDAMESSEVTEDDTAETEFFTAYVDDRWQLHKNLLIEGGLFLESFQDDYNDHAGLHPRLGLAWGVRPGHVVRLGGQSLLEKVSLGTLAPISTAGILVDDTQSLTGAQIRDFQARGESRWTDRIFTALGVGRAEIEDPELGPNYSERELRIDRAAAAVNVILAEQLAGFARWTWTDAVVTGGRFAGSEVPDIPVYGGGAGLVWISPRYLRASISRTYTGPSYAGYTNQVRLPGFWTTNASAGAELFARRLSVSVSVSNLFNEGTPTPQRSASISLECRF